MAAEYEHRTMCSCKFLIALSKLSSPSQLDPSAGLRTEAVDQTIILHLVMISFSVFILLSCKENFTAFHTDQKFSKTEEWSKFILQLDGATELPSDNNPMVNIHTLPPFQKLAF